MQSSILNNPIGAAMEHLHKRDPSPKPDAVEPDYRYSHGLDGVDLITNHRTVLATLIITIGIASLLFGYHMFERLNAHLRHMAAVSSPDSQGFWVHNNNSWWPWLKRHMFFAPFRHKRHNREFQFSTAINMGTAPGRFHFFLLFLWCTSNIAYNLALPWGSSGPNRSQELLAALRGRSGELAMWNLVPSVLFAFRSNPFIHILRTSYDTFNMFHRWGMRITTVEVIIHVYAWGHNVYNAGGWSAIMPRLDASVSYEWGAVSAAVFVFLVFQAWSPIRHAFWETFLNIHRLCALFAFLGAYIHLDTHKLPQLTWMQLILVAWILEWLHRFWTMTKYNIKLRNGAGLSQVKVEALPGDACRVTINLKRPWKSPKAGCHVYLCIPSIGLHSFHPFSVAWYDNDNRPSLTRSRQFAAEKHALPFTEQDLDAASRPYETHTISLICRMRSGFTRKMYEKAAQQPGGVLHTHGLIEGPYGGHHSFDSYGTVLLFAGGVGITHVIPYIRHLVAGYHKNDPTVSARKVVLVWSIPDTEALAWIQPWMNTILAIPGRKEVLRVMLFITRPKNALQVSSNSETIKQFPGRPPIQSIVDKEMMEQSGRMVVSVCGAGSFADEVRAATRRRMEYKALDFVEEAFTY